MDQVPAYVQTVVLVVLGVAGLAYLWSSVRKVRHGEVVELAETRGSRIEDLEAEVNRLKEKVGQLEQTVAAYQGIKADEIAVEVARLLEPRLPRRTDT